MNAPQLLRELQARGVVLKANGDHLRYDGPRAVLDVQVLAEVKAHKNALLELLRVAPETAPKPAVARTMNGFTVAAPTVAQIADQTKATRAEAVQLVARLRAAGVLMFLSLHAGSRHFAHLTLCVEYESVHCGDWHAFYRLRAEIHHVLHEESRALAKGAITHNSSLQVLGE